MHTKKYAITLSYVASLGTPGQEGKSRAVQRMRALLRHALTLQPLNEWYFARVMNCTRVAKDEQDLHWAEIYCNIERRTQGQWSGVCNGNWSKGGREGGNFQGTLLKYLLKCVKGTFTAISPLHGHRLWMFLVSTWRVRNCPVWLKLKLRPKFFYFFLKSWLAWIHDWSL